jgi:hypothetical protein
MTWRSMMDSMHSRYILYTVCSVDKRRISKGLGHVIDWNFVYIQRQTVDPGRFFQLLLFQTKTILFELRLKRTHLA